MVPAPHTYGSYKSSVRLLVNLDTPVPLKVPPSCTDSHFRVHGSVSKGLLQAGGMQRAQIAFIVHPLSRIAKA